MGLIALKVRKLKTFLFLIVDVQVSTLELEKRLNVFEENVNDSVVELQARVDALEITDKDHESRITATETVREGSNTT